MFNDKQQMLIDDKQLTHNQEKSDPAPTKVGVSKPLLPAPPISIAPAPPAAVLIAPAIMTPAAAPVMAPPLLPKGIHEPAKLELIKQNNDDVGNKSEQADHDQFNNQRI